MQLLFKEWLLEESTVTQYLKDRKISSVENVQFLSKEIKAIINQSFQLRQDIKDSLAKLFLFWKIKKDPELFSPTSIVLTNLQTAEAKREVRDTINHFRDFIMYQSNNNWSEFKKKLNSLDYSVDDMSRDDEEYHQSLRMAKRPKPPEGETVPLAGMPAGWTWVSLNKEYCKQEGEAMGHCGNAGFRPGDNIFSLRGPDGAAYLTFVVNDSKLGESKGRDNHKPSPKYHPQIMALLLGSWKGKPIVELIKGGGYKPENNFQVSDLSPEDQQILLKHNPFINDNIGSILNLCSTNKNQCLVKLRDLLNVSDPIRLDIDLENQEVILNRGGDSLYDFVENFLSQITNLHESLPDLRNFSDQIERMDFSVSDSEALNEFANYAESENKELLEKIAEKMVGEDFDKDDLEEIVKSNPEIMDMLRSASYDGYKSGYEIEFFDSLKNHLLGFYDFDKRDVWSKSLQNAFRIYEKDNKLYLAAKIKTIKEFDEILGFDDYNSLESFLILEKFDTRIISPMMDETTYNDSLTDGLEWILSSLD